MKSTSEGSSSESFWHVDSWYSDSNGGLTSGWWAPSLARRRWKPVLFAYFRCGRHLFYQSGSVHSKKLPKGIRLDVKYSGHFQISEKKHNSVNFRRNDFTSKHVPNTAKVHSVYIVFDCNIRDWLMCAFQGRWWLLLTKKIYNQYLEVL